MRLAQQQGGIITTTDVAELLRVSKKKAYRLLLDLVEKGQLKKVGKARATKYVVAS